MLHSTLPRAFLAPGLSTYLGYYGEEVHHPYVAPNTTWHIPMEDSTTYPTRISEPHHVLQPPSWESSRSSTPCPLDLSLKPPPSPSTPRADDAIEVDDEEDRRIREETQRRLENRMYRRGDSEEDDPLIVDDEDESTSVHSVHRSYEHHLRLKKESPQRQEMIEKTSLSEEESRLPPYPIDLAQKYHLHNQKFLLASPTQIQSMQTYHQQLLLTPQHHLQGMHAPMTPPSTPSPPQCPRRRTREEDVTSPSGDLSATPSTATAVVGSAASNVTPRQSSGDKSTPRPKKKHARRLKFDEDTSSPVSGTVILGPDEAVVTGDIDPAFNIVEVTEEARAELAKIENRLGPYQCKLCRQLHDDAFQLAQHRCSRIAHVEYRCPECDKRFSCPANLASHRRWHKPRLPNNETSSTTTSVEIACTRCDAKFTRQAALRKHLTTQHPETNGNNSSSNNVVSSGNNNSSSGANNNVVLDSQEVMATVDSMQVDVGSPVSGEIP